MTYDGDAFISYAHLDNVELIEGHKGWVANLHRALEVRVGQLLGKAPHIWRDPKLQGNDVFATTLVERLRRVAALVAVVSPRYVRSEWTRRELSEFWTAAEQQGGIKIRDKARVFKVLKTPVSNDLLPPELRTMLGYEFFRVDPETGRVRELDEVFGPEAQRDFWLRLDDLAHDICTLLEMLEVPGEAVAETAARKTEAVYLAETTSDLREQRESLRRDLLQHGYEVLPATVLPTIAAELEAAVSDDLERCVMSIHLVGKNYSLVPEGGAQSLVEIQNEMAIRRTGIPGPFSRLIWIPAGLEVSDPRQQKVIEQIRVDPRIQEGADVLETSLEELRTVYQERLTAPQPEPTPAPAATTAAAPVVAAPAAVKSIYLIYDQRDAEACLPWIDFMFEQGCEVCRRARPTKNASAPTRPLSSRSWRVFPPTLCTRSFPA
jgi:hypothetical protein